MINHDAKRIKCKPNYELLILISLADCVLNDKKDIDIKLSSETNLCQRY